MVPDIDSSPFVSSQQTTEGELYAGNAQSSSYLTGEPVAYLLGLVIEHARALVDRADFARSVRAGTAEALGRGRYEARGEKLGYRNGDEQGTVRTGEGILGGVLDLDFMVSHRESKFIAIDK